MTTTEETGHRPFASSIACLPLRFRPDYAPGIRMQVHVATTGPEPGNWLIAIDKGICHVFTGSIASPDARLYTSSEIGTEILSGALSIGEAVAGRLLDYDGDIEALRRFAACFQLGGAL